jgi:hypothetical protein
VDSAALLKADITDYPGITHLLNLEFLRVLDSLSSEAVRKALAKED